eukprot:gene7347-65520_t
MAVRMQRGMTMMKSGTKVTCNAFPSSDDRYTDRHKEFFGEVGSILKAGTVYVHV